MKQVCNQMDLFLTGKITEKNFFDHMEICPECRREYDLDQKITEDASRLNREISIPDLWPAIKKEIPNHLDSAKNGRTKLVKILLPFAAGFLIYVSFYFLKSPNVDTIQSQILTQQALQQVQKSENAYIDAIRQLEEIAENKIGETPEPLAQLYRNKLQLINNQIKRCQNALKKNPANAHLRKYLLAVLKEKKSALNDIMQLNIERKQS